MIFHVENADIFFEGTSSKCHGKDRFTGSGHGRAGVGLRPGGGCQDHLEEEIV